MKFSVGLFHVVFSFLDILTTLSCWMEELWYLYIYIYMYIRVYANTYTHAYEIVYTCFSVQSEVRIIHIEVIARWEKPNKLTISKVFSH